MKNRKSILLFSLKLLVSVGLLVLPRQRAKAKRELAWSPSLLGPSMATASQR
mgnify:CR=1 FL=1